MGKMVVLIGLVCAVAVAKEPGTILYSFSAPSHEAYGLAYDGQYLWCSTSPGTIYKLTLPEGTPVDSFAVPDTLSTDLDWDGRYLWIVGNEHHRCYKIDPASGEVLFSFEVSWPQGKTPRLMGIASANNTLWVVDQANELFYQIDPTTGLVIHSEPNPFQAKYGDGSMGLAYDGRWFIHPIINCFVDCYETHLVRINLPQSGEVETISLGCGSASTVYLAASITSVTYDPGDYNLWVNDEVGWSIKKIVGFNGMGTKEPEKVDRGFNLTCKPNPARGAITIDFSLPWYNLQPVSGCLYNSTGEIVKQFTIRPKEGTNEMNIAGLSAGVYFVSLASSSIGTAIEKIIILK
jgi:hypothetical protein